MEDDDIFQYFDLLPDHERVHIAEDDNDQLRRLNEALSVLNDCTQSIIDPTKLGNCVNAIRTRQKLKYCMPTEICSRILDVFYKVYINKQSSVVQRKYLFSTMHSIIKLKVAVSFIFDWRQVWTEARSISLRCNRSRSVSNPNVTAELMMTIADFLHDARNLLNQEVAREIIVEAMDLLVDVRSPHCYEGLLLLINCLPTKCGLYDEYLPQWVSTWSKLQYHQHWDCCWLTLLTRARKHSTSFNWTSLAPLLIAKMKELVLYSKKTVHQLPLPAHFFKLLILPDAAAYVALNKCAKLLYFISLLDVKLVPSAVITLTPPTAASVLRQDGDGFAYGGYCDSVQIHRTIMDLALLYQSIRSCLHPSSTQFAHSLAVFTCSLVREVCRHLGKCYVRTLVHNALVATNTNLQEASFRVSLDRPVHMPSTRYLLGLLAVLVMEGIYSSNAQISYFYSTSLKSLLAVDPSLMEHIVPYLLAPLLPEAVSQSRQTPVALQTLWMCLKGLLFPHPVFVRHLPALLRLILPGIDVNDRSKTNESINIVITIFSHVPVVSEYYRHPSIDEREDGTAQDSNSLIKEGVSISAPPYLSQVSCEGGSNEDGSKWIQSQLSTYQQDLETLGEMWVEWLPLFLDRLFVLLDAEESKQKGADACPVTSSVPSCIDALFHAVRCPLLLTLINDIIISYFCRAATMPINAVKTAARFMEYLVGRSPHLLESTVRKLLELDRGGLSLTHTSHEKIAFRLRLVGGAVRRATAPQVNAHLHLILPYLQNQYFHHTEKAVRKAASKLAKDVIKGACSFSVIGGDDEGTQTIGGVTMISQEKIKWHCPTAAHLDNVLDFCAEKTEWSVSEVRRLVSQDSNAKLVEETVAVHLKLVSRLLRGIADIIPDEHPDLSHDESEVDRAVHVPHTGREEVFQQLSVEMQEYLSSLRLRLLRFLSEIHDQLGLDSTAESLRNSPSVRSQWTKLLLIITCARFHNKKSIDKRTKHLKDYVTAAQTTFVHTVHKELERLKLPDEVASIQKELQAEYWDVHDKSRYMVWARAFLTKARRVKEYCSAVLHNQLLLTTSATSEGISCSGFGMALARCFQQLDDVCSHEYDTVRSRGVKCAMELFHYVGKKVFMETIMNSRMAAIINPGLLPKSIVQDGNRLYGFIMSSLVLMCQPRVLDAVVRRWDLTCSHIQALLAAPMLIAQVGDGSKRERLLGRLTDAVVAYATSFNHLSCEENDASGILDVVLRSLGYDSDSGCPLSIGSSSVINNTSSNNSATGFRLEAHAAWLLLHLIGHDSISIPPGVIGWTLTTLCTAMGRPSQPLALAAFVRMMHIASVLPSAISPACLNKLHSMLNVSFGDIPFALSTENSIVSWPKLLQGIASCHSRSGKWAPGVGKLITAASYLRAVGSVNVVSEFGENCHALSQLFSLLLQSAPAQADMVSLARNLLVEVGPTLPATNETEKRANNVTTAEVFSGLYRCLLQNRALLSDSGGVLEILLVDHFEQQIDRVSYSYSSDWANAAYFAVLEAPYAFGEREGEKDIGCPVAEECRLVTKTTQSLGKVLNPPHGGDMDANGFLKNDKRLYIGRAVLLSYLKTCVTCLPSKPTSGMGLVGRMSMALLHVPNLQLVSRYSSTRAEIYELAAVLDRLLLYQTVVNDNLYIVTNHLVTALESTLPLITIVTMTSSRSSHSFAETASEGSEISLESMSAVVLEPVATVDTGVNEIGFGGMSGSDDRLSEDSSASSQGSNNEDSNRIIMRSKVILECICSWTLRQISELPTWKYERQLPALLNALLSGSAHPRIDIANRCQSTAISLCLSVWPRETLDPSGPAGTSRSPGNNVWNGLLDVMEKQTSNNSRPVRRTIATCVASLYSVAGTHLSAQQLHRIKELLLELMLDENPEVSKVGVKWMSAYLLHKTGTELNKLAQTFIQNSNILIAREKKKRRDSIHGVTTYSGSGGKPDKQYQMTFIMLSCLVRSFPYDLPSFMPDLITAFLRHSSTPCYRDIVTRIIRDFQKTHHDRWEEFKHKFSSDQLDVLQGAGAAHYFS